MKRIRKMIVSCLCLWLFVLTGCMTAAAWTGRIDDGASLLSGSEMAKVSEKLNELVSETGYDFFAVTTDDNGGDGPRAYAEDYFNAHCSGNDGAVFLIDMGERTMQIVTAGKMIYYLTDERIDRTLDRAYDYAADGDYAGVFESMISDTKGYVASGTGADHLYNEDTGEIIKIRALTFSEIGISLLLGLVSAAGAALAVIASYRMKFSKYIFDYHKHSKLSLSDERDVLIGKSVTHRRIPRNDSTRGGGGHGSGGSTFHVGSGGRSFGGGSRKF